MRTKWASLSPGGRLTLNSELVALPRRLGEYVIVHELVHPAGAQPRQGVQELPERVSARLGAPGA
jgi:hypothetical protein